MMIYVKTRSFLIFLGVLMGFSGMIEATTVTCEPQYGFLPCTSEIWGTLFLIVVYQYLMSVGQHYISNGSDMFFGLIGPGIFGASLFHILANFPMLLLVLESGLSTDDMGAATSAGMGMSLLAGSAVMNLTLIWPLVIAFGSSHLADGDDSTSPQLPGDEPSFLTKLTTYGVVTDNETRYTSRLMLVSVIPFIILQLPAIINSTSVTQVIILITLIFVLSLFVAYILYQIFQPWIQNRRFDYVREDFVKNNLLNLLSTNGKPNVQHIKRIYAQIDQDHDAKVSNAELKTFLLGINLQADDEIDDGLIERIMNNIDISRDTFIDEFEFVNVLTTWLKEAHKSLGNNDYKPLQFFTKLEEDADEEKQVALIPKENPDAKSLIPEFLHAFSLVLFGTVVTALVSQPLITNVVTFATALNIPSFFIPYFIIPCAINITRLLSSISSASQKTQRALSLTLSQIYSGVCMNSLSSLTTFLLTMYIRNVPWDESAEVLVMLIICGVMGIFASTRKVFPLWTSYVVYLMYPISLLMLYLLTVVWGW